MLISVLSDVHANMPALKAVLADMPSVDRLVCLGDVVGYGPNPTKTTKTIRNKADLCIRGNHEMYLEDPTKASGNAGSFEGIKYAREELSQSQYEWLTTLPMRSTVGETVGAVHGHPDEDDPWKYVTKRNITKLIPVIADATYSILGVGHSHIQFKQDLRKFYDESGIVFNPGSVGQPRDGDPRAGYAVIDTEVGSVDLRRVEYDIETTVSEIEAASLPVESGERLRIGQMPPGQKYQ